MSIEMDSAPGYRNKRHQELGNRTNFRKPETPCRKRTRQADLSPRIGAAWPGGIAAHAGDRSGLFQADALPLNPGSRPRRSGLAGVEQHRRIEGEADQVALAPLDGTVDDHSAF